MLVYFFSLKKLNAPLSTYSNLETMLAKRKLGASYMSLADEFGVTKDTIVYLCRKFGLGGKMNPPLARTTRVKPPRLYNELRINLGKTYAEYLQDEQDRKWKNLTQKY